MLDVYGGEPGKKAPNGGMSPTSNPTKLTHPSTDQTNQLKTHHELTLLQNSHKLWLEKIQTLRV